MGFSRHVLSILAFILNTRLIHDPIYPGSSIEHSSIWKFWLKAQNYQIAIFLYYIFDRTIDKLITEPTLYTHDYLILYLATLNPTFYSVGTPYE